MNSYETLKYWLKNDLGSITNLASLAQYIELFLYKTGSQAEQDQKFKLNVIEPMQSILNTINNNVLSINEKIANANEILKNIFIENFFRREYYNKRIEVLKKDTNYEAEIISRLKSSNSLVTLDGVFTLKDDPRNLSQITRAATLIAATVSIFTKLQQENTIKYDTATLTWESQSPYFGRTVVTTDKGNSLHIDTTSKHVTVLINGQAYYLEVIDDNGTPCSVKSLINNLQTILNDFEKSAHHAALGCITAAPRDLIHKTRKSMENRGENGKLFKLIDSSLFIVCLDHEDDLSHNKEKQIKRLFNNFNNRWYGTTQIVIGPSGEAGVISSYTRGDNVPSAVALIDKIAETALQLPISDSTFAPKDNYPFKKLSFDIKADELTPLVKATSSYFHNKKSLFNLDIGIEFFLKRGLHPNAALQLLIMLAAMDIDSQKRLPIFAQALAVKDAESTGSALDWTFIATHKIKQFISAVNKNETTAKGLFAIFKNAVDTYADTIKNTQDGWSPTFFLQKPEGELYNALCDFFITIGNELGETGYAGYLFRPARMPRSMDILVSFHKLPKNITMLGRPGGALEAVNKFGAHIAFSRKTTEFSWMPNVNADINPADLDNSLKKWISYIDRISDEAN
jgi:hypothetical protein